MEQNTKQDTNPTRMDFLWMTFDQNPQLTYQLFTIPLAFVFYILATQGYLTLFDR